MQLSRASTRALKALTTTTSKQTTRHLSMTGAATSSSLLTSDKPVLGRSQVPRLPASARIPVPDTTDTGKLTRHFNTSRSMKAPNDTSTIDFTVMPDFDPDMRSGPVQIRVPILPWTAVSETTKASVAETEQPIFVPVVHTVAADDAHVHAPSALTEKPDGGHIDFQAMTTQFATKLNKPVEEGVGMVRQIWSGLMEDIVGSKQGPART
ncbi:hypothetical protein P153DRAFT_321065 [Dothidotthia symphoricarpi CBS 119687]|uniref:Uncharacterized protein n=1 Tax=Dothidotthia symphoricarpi CBS 119687 TaxID=1392245 RepID=A0A6A6A5U2_9PLEO|nr:uncharacterized protein P153DRAFT_321065 [Dothidotthia symphoricarpi CBS 119687]KAF2127352.1 hypothetical protein P153DRAFT_321065 [Dothidotthia symphoricarpi CBS 119687]